MLPGITSLKTDCPGLQKITASCLMGWDFRDLWDGLGWGGSEPLSFHLLPLGQADLLNTHSLSGQSPHPTWMSNSKQFLDALFSEDLRWKISRVSWGAALEPQISFWGCFWKHFFSFSPCFKFPLRGYFYKFDWTTTKRKNKNHKLKALCFSQLHSAL